MPLQDSGIKRGRPPKVYYHRMITFVLGLVLLFTTAMTVFYLNQKSLLLSESELHLNNIAALITDHLSTLERELEQRVSMINSNAVIQQYMFIVAELEGEPESFRRIFTEQVGPLQDERAVVITGNGVAVVGGDHRDLVDFARRRLPAEPPPRSEITYIYTRGRLEILAYAGMFYQDRPTGLVLIGRPLDERFLELLKHRSGGDLFLVLDGKVLHCTVGHEGEISAFGLEDDLLRVKDVPYRVRRIDLKGKAGGGVPELWLGVNQQRLFDFLDRFLLTSVIITLIGGAATLVFGIYLIRRIVRPIWKLVNLTQSVSSGNLPQVHEVPIHDEMDYLTSGFYSMVESLKKDRQKIEEANRLLLQQAITDHLTGLYNRRYFNEILPKLLSLNRRKGTMMHILLMDIDNFKRINDTYGHACGDAVLIAFAEILKKTTRKSDFCFRIGGEEFVLILNAGTLEGAVTTAEKIRVRVEGERIRFSGAEVSCTVSIGVVKAEKDVDPDELLKMADRALYSAKNQGRNRVCVNLD